MNMTGMISLNSEVIEILITVILLRIRLVRPTLSWFIVIIVIWITVVFPLSLCLSLLNWVQILELNICLQVYFIHLSILIFADMSLIELLTRFFFGFTWFLLVFLQFLFLYGSLGLCTLVSLYLHLHHLRFAFRRRRRLLQRLFYGYMLRTGRHYWR